VKILLVRLRLIGDVIFTTPLIRELRRRYADAEIVYLVERGAAPIVRGNPHVNEVIVVDHTRGWRRVRDDLRLACTLRRARFDAAIDLHGGPRSAWLTWATRAPVRVGYDITGRGWMYTTQVHRPRELRPRHSVENQWDLLQALDPRWQAGADPDRDRVEMPVDAAALAAMDRRYATAGVSAGDRVIVLHVSAGNPFRRWPESAFAELAAGLAAGGPRRWVFVTSGPSDHDAAARVVASASARAGTHGDRIIDAEGWSLDDLRAAVERAALFVGGDSGPLHIASTSNVPIVGLYGPTLAERSAPWRPPRIPTAAVDSGVLPCRPCDQRVCVPGDFRCLSGIPAERVLAAAETLLSAG
jgi:predicted lipopolysaccharide heptosyltransferase III